MFFIYLLLFIRYFIVLGGRVEGVSVLLIVVVILLILLKDSSDVIFVLNGKWLLEWVIIFLLFSYCKIIW